MILTKLKDKDGFFFCIHFEPNRRTFFNDTIQECLAEIKNIELIINTIPEKFKILYQIEFEKPEDLMVLIPEEFL